MINFMTVGDRLKQLRKNNGYTQQFVADKLGVGKTTVSNYETSYSNPDGVSLLKLAQIFNVTVDYILGGTLMPTVNEVPDRPYVTTEKIPVVGVINAGQPLYAQENIVDYISMPRDLIGVGEYFGLVVKGDSMNRSRIDNGDTVLVRKQDYVNNGEIAVVLIDNNDATIKRFYQHGNIVQLTPDSTNSVHEPLTYDISKISIRILGKVERAIIKI